MTFHSGGTSQSRHWLVLEFLTAYLLSVVWPIPGTKIRCPRTAVMRVINLIPDLLARIWPLIWSLSLNGGVIPVVSEQRWGDLPLR